MFGWLKKRFRATAATEDANPIPDALWNALLLRYSFIRELPQDDIEILRSMSASFLRKKEFFGANGFRITDEVALCIAAQACLPVIHLGLHWYDDFVGIVVHSGEVVAHREFEDEDGIVHHYDEVLTGEAMEGGPVTLSWTDVDNAGRLASEGYNVVIHEFAHKLDMRDGAINACPLLPPGFRQTGSATQAHLEWMAVMRKAFEAFRERVIIAERFSGEPAWLDAYGAESIEEFFAVSCEAYFVNRPRFRKDFEELAAMYDEFFKIESTQ